MEDNFNNKNITRDLTMYLRKIAQEFADQAKRKYPDKIEKIILFGSVARDEMMLESDIDFLVICTSTGGDRFKVRRMIMDDVVSFLLKYGVYISVIVSCKTLSTIPSHSVL
ncbi:MAG: nucleotidyltransferase domain-containing protein [Candidatus Syntropharchaeales archaeon]